MNVIQPFTIHLLLLLRDTYTQFINNVQPGYMPFYQPQRQYDDYIGRWGIQGSQFHRRSGGRFPEYSLESNDYGRARCKCSCRNCEKVKPCCLSICNNCNTQSLVFIPYPIPLIVTLTSTTTAAPTTTKTTSQSTTRKDITTFSTPTPPISEDEPIKELPDNYDYGISTVPYLDFKKKKTLIKKKPTCLKENYRRKDLMDSPLRIEDIPRSQVGADFPSRHNRGQRFGIIPIPDNLALKFMTYMRDMKLSELQS